MLQVNWNVENIPRCQEDTENRLIGTMLKNTGVRLLPQSHSILNWDGNPKSLLQITF